MADQLTAERGAVPTAVVRNTASVLGRLCGARNTPQYTIVDPTGVLCCAMRARSTMVY